MSVTVSIITKTKIACHCYTRSVNINYAWSFIVESLVTCELCHKRLHRTLGAQLILTQRVTMTRNFHFRYNIGKN